MQLVFHDQERGRHPSIVRGPQQRCRQDIMRFSLVVVGVFGLVAGLSTWFVVTMQRAELARSNVEFDKYKVETAKMIAVLGKDAADANARALEAQVALEKFKAPRSISPDQRNRIAEEVKQYSGQEFYGMVASDVADAWDIWREISLSLELAGWKRIPPQGLQAKQYGPPAGIALAPQAGVMIFSSAGKLPPLETMALHDRAKVLAAKLNAESITAGAGFASDLDANVIAIVIGPKP